MLKLIRNTKIMSVAEVVLKNNQRNEEIIISLQNEITAIRKEIISKRKKELIEENANLKQCVQKTLAELITLETQNGKSQIAVPGVRSFCTQATVDAPEPPPVTVTKPTKETKPQKEAKPKKEKPPKVNSTASAASAEAPIDVGRLDFRIGKIIEVGRHPDADSLYLEKIDCGEPQPRTVVSGLVKYVPIEEMQNRFVVVLCNLKPAKMRGITSEAMVMCASTPERVEVLSPPDGVTPGDLVYCEGYERKPDAQLNPKKKIFETCAPELKTNSDLIACYKGVPLHVPGKGNIVTQTLKNAPVK